MMIVRDIIEVFKYWYVQAINQMLCSECKSYTILLHQHECCTISKGMYSEDSVPLVYSISWLISDES